MHRFYLPPEECRGQSFTLEEREAHHGLNVLRLRVGERVTVLDGKGGEYICEVCEMAKHSIHLRLIQKHVVPPLPYRITLIQAVPKGKTMDTIIQKTTELGVARIVPLLSERVVPHIDSESAKVEKWRQAAIEAAKQCGSAWLPEIEPPVTPREFLARNERFDLPLIASLQPDSRHPRQCFKNYYDERVKLPATICVWVGPEGDFTPAEMNAARSAGALPITLGRLILRSDTAAIYCLAVLNYEMQAGQK